MMTSFESDPNYNKTEPRISIFRETGDIIKMADEVSRAFMTLEVLMMWLISNINAIRTDNIRTTKLNTDIIVHT